MLPKTSSRLSAFLDPSLFIAPPMTPRNEEHSAVADTTLPRSKSLDINHLTASPVHVDPYPPRRSDGAPARVIDSPDRRRIECVYDRFLMAASGVKRVGRGYQSDNIGPVLPAPEPRASTLGYNHNRNHNRVFNSVRRAMPPPVSSDDLKTQQDVDEFGLVARTLEMETVTPNHKGEGNNTVALVRRAFKAVVTGKTVTNRLSRTAVA